MADTSKKFSELTTASQVNETDIVAMSQEGSGGTWSSVKATILALATKIATGINFTSALQTTNKTLTGAINEAAQSGGSGGHTILDDSGNELTQRDDLQFKGIYTHDDSINGKTVGEVYREMTLAQFNQLSAAEKLGLIRITDDNSVCDATEVTYDSNNTVKQKIDAIDLTSGGNITGDVIVDKKDGTTSVVGRSKLVLGNSTLATADENSKGVMRVYTRGSKYVDICASDNLNYTDNREINVPDQNGTIALKSDLHTELVKLTPNANETNSQLLVRFQTAMANVTSDAKRLGIIQMIVGGNEKVFHCARFTSNNYMAFSCMFPNANAVVEYFISYGGSGTVGFYQLTVDSNGFTKTNLANDVAEGNIIFKGFEM